MNATLAIMLAAGVASGAGLIAVQRGLVVVAPSLEEIAARVDGSTASLRVPAHGSGSGSGAGIQGVPRVMGRPAARAGTWVAGRARQVGLEKLVARDLALTGKPLDVLAAESVLWCVIGVATPALLAGAAGAAGMHVPFLVPLWAMLVAGLAGAAGPVYVARKEAALARRRFVFATGVFLDLVVLGLAGGMGVEEAIESALATSAAEPFRRISTTLAEARVRGVTPWSALGELGDATGIEVLTELAASLALAGNEGAKVRSSLAAKAESLRRHRLAAEQAAANAATERMFLPGVLLLCGFLVFVGFPAIMRIFEGL